MGREPTSASCHTCRRRRIRCDKGKPSCAQCQKSQHECLGYQRILRIQSHGVGRSSLVKIGQSDSYPADSSNDCDDHLSPHDCSESCRQKKQERQINGNATPTTSNLTKHLQQPLISQSVRLTLDPFVDNVTFSYFFDAYSWINVHSIFLQDTPMRQHLTQQKDELGYDSLRALAYGIFGRDHQVEGLRRKAERIYGTNLQRLQSKLAAASKSELATLIKPISIMGSYAVRSGDIYNNISAWSLLCVPRS